MGRSLATDTTPYDVRRSVSSAAASMLSGIQRSPARLNWGYAKAGWHDADDRDGGVVEDQRASNHRRVRAESGLPQGVAQHNHVVCAAGPVAVAKVSPDQWLDPQEREGVWGDAVSLEPCGAVDTSQVGDQITVGRDGLERTRRVAPLDPVGRLDVETHRVGAQVPAQREDDAVRVAIGQRSHQQRVHGAEDRRVGTDAEGERQHGDRREARILAQDPQAVTQILPERFNPRSDPHISHLVLCHSHWYTTAFRAASTRSAYWLALADSGGTPTAGAPHSQSFHRDARTPARPHLSRTSSPWPDAR